MIESGTLMKRAATASVAVSAFLVAIKTGAYFASHSVAMLASMADSALDLLASLLNMLAIRHALTPADAEHRFGHGKAEPLAGLAQGAVIAASALFLSIEAVQRIAAGGTVLDPEVVSHLLGRRHDPLATLTPREHEVMALMAEGRTNAAIAAQLVIGTGAVEKNVTSIFQKLGLDDSGNDHRRVLAVLTYLGS